MLKQFLSLLLFFSIVLVVAIERVYPQPIIEWTRIYGGDNERDSGNSVKQTFDGGYIIAGEKSNPYINYSKIYLIKTDSNGDSLWTRLYDGSDCYSVQQTFDSGYILVGSKVIKTDSLGNIQWENVYSSPKIYSIQQTADGGYILAGTGLIKIDESGSIQWENTYFGLALSVQQTSDGDYVCTGIDGFPNSRNIYLLKTNSTGNTTWLTSFAKGQTNVGRSAQQTSDAGYIIAGYTRGQNTDYEDAYLIKTDSLGNKQWEKTFSARKYREDRAYAVQQTSDGGYILAGETSDYMSYEDYYIIKTDAFGEIIWTNTYSQAQYQRARSIQQTADGGYIIVGESGSDYDHFDIYMIKLGADISDVDDDYVKQDQIKCTLFQNYPNPFNADTAIKFDLPTAKNVNLSIYNISGQLVETLVDDYLQPGIYTKKWNAGHLNSGIYFIRLAGDGYSFVRKCSIVK